MIKMNKKWRKSKKVLIYILPSVYEILRTSMQL